MIRQAVRSHFEEVALNDDLVTNYFDKLIQLPIRVPPLGTHEVRAYLMMLFVDAETSLEVEQKEEIRIAVCRRLGRTWKGERVDKSFVSSLMQNCPPGLLNRLSLAERIAPLLTTSPNIQGNPRLIKRFLNTLSLRSSMARIQEVVVDEAVLVKLLLFERCGDKDAYSNSQSAGRSGPKQLRLSLTQHPLAGAVRLSLRCNERHHCGHSEVLRLHEPGHVPATLFTTAWHWRLSRSRLLCPTPWSRHTGPSHS